MRQIETPCDLLHPWCDKHTLAAFAPNYKTNGGRRTQTLEGSASAPQGGALAKAPADFPQTVRGASAGVP
jgi:hypothetical protein